MTNSTTLVLGGTGKTGRRIVDRLAAQGRSVRVGSRSGRPPFDWHDQGTWEPAVSGVSAAYLAYAPDLAVPGAAETVGEFARYAAGAGVRRLVLLSGRGEPAAERAEQLVAASGAEWTVVRASWFAQNFSEGILRDPVLAGELALPIGDVVEPLIDVEDIADVAVAALTDERHAGQLYEVTGPRLLSFGQAAKEISAAVGREVRYLPVAMADFTAGLAAAGMPAEEVEFLRYLLTEVMDGRNAVLADGVERALGRPARDFQDFARAAAAAGTWD